MTLHLTAVGVGPGDPEWITVKGMRALQAAHVVFAPRSNNGPESVALRIARPWLRPDQTIVELPLPMTRDARTLAVAWRQTAERIAATLEEVAVRQGSAQGVYVVLGDPLFYGTFTYIWQELAQRHPEIGVDVVPGVTSFAAAAARAGLPLATTSDRVAILPATYETDQDRLAQLLREFDTVVLMKVGRVWPRVRHILADLGLEHHTLYAEHVGMEGERLLRGDALLNEDASPYLSLLIVRRKKEDV